MTYTHDMVERYLSRGLAKDEAYNYSDTDMSADEIRADIEECLKGDNFEIAEDRENYISAILDAVNRQRADI